MSNTVEATQGQDPYTPSAEDINNAGKIESWRIANGKWRTGEGEDGTAQKDTIVGKPTRFGVTEEYTTKDGKVVAPKFRITLKLPDGGSFSGQMRLDSTQARYLMGALTLWDGQNYISITPNLSTKRNIHGKFTTYANVKVCEGPGKWVELRWSAGDAAWADLPLSLQEELYNEHPTIYKNWVSEDDENDVMPWAGLDQWLRLKGFEEFTGQPEYLEFIRKGTKNATWDANNCTDWAGVQELFAKYESKIPDSMRMTTGPANDEFDPFADE